MCQDRTYSVLFSLHYNDTVNINIHKLLRQFSSLVYRDVVYGPAASSISRSLKLHHEDCYGTHYCLRLKTGLPILFERGEISTFSFLKLFYKSSLSALLSWNVCQHCTCNKHGSPCRCQKVVGL